MRTRADSVDDRPLVVVFTGGSGTGKTTILNALKEQQHGSDWGFIDEAAMR